MNPFDFVKDISFDKKYLIEGNEKEYNAWLTNKAFSYHPDSIFIANECNKYNMYGMDNILQHDFLFNILDKRKRFSKWSKTHIDDEIKLVSEYYNISISKARDYHSILSKEHIQTIKKSLDGGGLKK